MMTLFEQHCNRWKNGCGWDGCHRARNRVFLRGRLPCDVLFVGEAPGESEDALGRPFMGPAGKLLDRIIARAFGDPPAVSWAFTNVVACVPRLADGEKATEPDDEQCESCRPRLQEIIDLARPRLCVAVGRVAEEWLDQAMKHAPRLPAECKLIEIVHPANLLRDPVAAQGLKIQRCEVVLRNAVEGL